MADERILKEYDGIKDGETVHLSIKAAVAGATTSTTTTTTTSTAPTTAPSAISPMPSPLPASEFAAPAPPKDTLSASPSPFGFQSQAMSPTSGSPSASKRRARTSSQLSSATNHSRVPSITLTTDFSNFNNLSGSATSPIDGNVNPGVPMASSPELNTSGIASPPFSPGQSAGPGGASGTSTPRSAPGTPYSGGRGRTPSISIPIDLDNLDLMNPISSDRRLPVGLSPALIKTIREPGTWSDLLDFLESKITQAQAAVAAGKGATGRESPTPLSASTSRPEPKEYSEDTIKLFENWLGASKDWMNASDIARIRDSTGIFGMAGR